jgi:predicted nucleic acid-binding protein
VRIFLDANILFSAAKSDGAISELIALLLEARHECCADAYVFEEARRNLLAKAPDRMAALERLAARVKIASARRGDAALEASLPLPPKDRPVLAAAIHHGCAALLTGDRTHFGDLFGRTVHGVTVYSPRLLAERLLTGPTRAFARGEDN